MGTKEKKLFVLDTNVILHDQTSIWKFKEHDVCILSVVLEELDTFKKDNDIKGVNVRNFHRELKKLSKTVVKKKISQGKNAKERDVPALSHGGVSLGEGLGKIELQVSSTKLNSAVGNAFNDATPDHQILNKVYELQKSEQGKRRVILVTKDMNLHFKAQMLGIEVEDYEHDKVPETDELYLGRKEIHNPDLDEIIKALYKNNGSGIKIVDAGPIKEETLKPNMYLVLSSGSASALARVDENMEYIYRVEKQTISTIEPRNAEQAFAVNALLNQDISLVTFQGKAGTGKTLLAIAAGIKQLKEEKYDKVIISAAMVTMGNKEMGALPGNAIEKVLPFMNGLNNNIEIIKDRIPKNSKDIVVDQDNTTEKRVKKQTQNQNRSKKSDDYISVFQENGKIIIQPLAYIRGSTFNKAFFIIDEFQNLTPKEAKTIITRAGEGTKVVVCGDIRQIDTPYLDSRSNGLSYTIHKFLGQKIYAHMTLVKGERSNLAELAADLMD